MTERELPLMGDASPRLQKAMRVFLDCFSGADSGGSFYAFCQFLVAIDKQASDSTHEYAESSKEIIDRVVGVSRLISYAENEMRKQVRKGG